MEGHGRQAYFLVSCGPGSGAGVSRSLLADLGAWGGRPAAAAAEADSRCSIGWALHKHNACTYTIVHDAPTTAAAALAGLCTKTNTCTFTIVYAALIAPPRAAVDDPAGQMLATQASDHHMCD